MVVVRVPGKLFIAGEYAVTEPGFPAVLAAVDQFITVFIEKSAERGSIRIYDDTIFWTRDNEKLILEKQDNRLKYILSAINIVERYIKELGRNLSYFNLRVDSDLVSQNGVKYGLGSSAAVTVGTVEALLKFYDIEITLDKLFKLSALANISINDKGSCGDIAACVYSGWTAYTSFDRKWASEKLNSTTISEILNLEWPNLSIERLMPPEKLNLAIGWTGQPSSTLNLLDRVNDRRLKQSTIYERFLYDSKRCVEKIISAFKSDDIDEIQRQIQINRELLVKLGNELGVEIETLKLKKLCDIASKYKGSGKSSGAGGGDCGIAIFNGDYNLAQLVEEWNEWGITYLPLSVYNKVNRINFN